MVGVSFATKVATPSFSPEYVQRYLILFQIWSSYDDGRRSIVQDKN